MSSQTELELLASNEGLAEIVQACDVLIRYFDAAVEHTDTLELANPSEKETVDTILAALVGTREQAVAILELRRGQRKKN